MAEKTKKKKESVTVFNEKVDEHAWDGNDNNFGFGIIIITGGILLLFNTLGILSWDIWNHILPFWPVLLVLWGMQLILGRNPLSRIFLGLATLGAVLLVAFYAVRIVKPSFERNLPVQINNVLDTMEEAKR